MTIQNHYHEVLTFGEQLMIFIIRALQTRPECQHLVNIIKKAGYPEAGDFQLPPGDEAVRITFAEAKKMLKESGYDIGEDEMEDIEYIPLHLLFPCLYIPTMHQLTVLRVPVPPKKKPLAPYCSRNTTQTSTQ